MTPQTRSAPCGSADRQRSEEALRQSEDRFRSAMQHSPIGMALVAPDGRWLEVNPSLCKIIGYRSSELLALDAQSVTHPEDLHLVMEAIHELLEGRADNFEKEMRYIHKDGREIWVQMNVSLITNPDGAPRHFVTQIQDVTGRRQAEFSLRNYQSKLGLAMDMAKLGHWEYDIGTSRFTFDQSFYKLIGTTIAREGGMWMSAEDYSRRFIPPDEISVVANETDKAVASNDPHFTRQLEHGFIRADGSTGVMSVRFAIVKDDAGRTVSTYGLNQDITEQRRAGQQRQNLEDQLRQSQKMEALGTLAGGIAHDFNNILTGIMGHLQLAELDLPEGHPALAMVRESSTASKRARDLVARILSFSRLERADRTESTLGPIVLEAVQLLRASLPSKIEIRCGIDSDCHSVRCDVAQIHQVIINLGTNAAHAMDNKSGVLTVDLRAVEPSPELQERYPQVKSNHTVCLTLRDTGCGMDRVLLKRIFEPFFTTKAFGQGTGLGLAIVHAIIQHHNGAITVESEPGIGTTFSLYFPGVGGRPTSPPSSPRSTTAADLIPFGRGRNILLVDDEAAVRSFGGDVLSRLGFNPTVLGHPAMALEAFRGAPASFCAVISDLTMPDMTGLELARHVLEIRPDIPFILASGYLNLEANEKARQSGVKCIIAKPFAMHELAARLRSVLNEPPAPVPAQATQAPF
jgi:PAS domain S-box-containing protein